MAIAGQHHLLGDQQYRDRDGCDWRNGDSLARNYTGFCHASCSDS
jgi:hypothetical protein